MKTTTTNKAPSLFEHLSIDDFWKILRRRVHWIVISTVLVGGISVAVVRQLPPMYHSETVILVDPQKVPEKYVMPTVSMDVGGRLNTIQQEILSSSRLQRLIENYDLYKEMRGHSTQEEIIDAMRKDIKIEVVSNEAARTLGAFRIHYQGRNPAVVAQVCTEIASLFIGENLRVREQQAQSTSEFLDTQLAAAKKKLEDTEAKVKDFKLQHVGELPEQATNIVATLARLQVEIQSQTDALNRASTNQIYLQNTLASMKALQPVETAPSSPDASPAAAPTSETLMRLRKEKGDLEGQLTQLLARELDTHPDVRRTREALKSINAQIVDEQKRLASLPAGAKPVAPPKPPSPAAVQEVSLKNQLQAVQTEIEQRKKEQQRISDQIRVYQSKLDNMPIREQQIVETVRDYEMSKAFYQSLLDKKMSADMAADMEHRQKSERFTVLDAARVPEKPFKPDKPVLAAIGVLAGFILGIGIVIVFEILDSSIRKEQELVGYNVPVLARIPVLEDPDEQRAAKRRLIRNWALGSAATLASLALCSVVATLITRRLVQ